MAANGRSWHASRGNADAIAEDATDEEALPDPGDDSQAVAGDDAVVPAQGDPWQGHDEVWDDAAWESSTTRWWSSTTWKDDDYGWRQDWRSNDRWDWGSQKDEQRRFSWPSSTASAHSGGKMSDQQVRDFHVADILATTAMADGKWAGVSSWDGGSYHDQGGAESGQRPSEKISVPEFDGEEAGDGDVGRSARSYIRKVQAWVRATRLPPPQRALALYSSLKGRRGSMRRSWTWIAWGLQVACSTTWTGSRPDSWTWRSVRSLR